jgi:cell division transport system ATP-binding protein
MISLKNVTKIYGTKTVLNHLSLRIDPASALCIVGASGSGKTTLAHLLIRATDPTEGSVEVDGVNISTVPPPILQLYRRRVGVIFQDALLVETATVEQNVALPLELLGAPAVLVKRNVTDLLKRLGLGAKASLLPDALSMSERALVGIARAIVTSPMVIVADEPFKDLDNKQVETICELLGNMRKKGTTVVAFSRSAATARALGAEALELKDGKIGKQSAAETAETAHRMFEPKTDDDDTPLSAVESKQKEYARAIPIRSQSTDASAKKVRITSIGANS